MKSNILFLLIDSLRADKVQGKNRACKTPNIDKLITNGTYFKQAITSSDATPLSIKSIFTSLLPFRNGTVFHPKIEPGVKTIIDYLKSEGYHTYGMVPDIKNIEFLYSSFENSDKSIGIEENWPRFEDGIGNKIIEKISSLKEPWFYYIHALDVHAKVLPGMPSLKIPKKYESSNYGNNRHEKSISALDEWIGKILKKIDLENTIIILTADHGSYIPFYQKEDIKLDFEEDGISKNMPVKKIPKFIKPFAKKIYHKNKSNELKKILDSIEKYNLSNSIRRNLLARFFKSNEESAILYDDLVHVPMVIQGPNIPKKMIVDQQVSNRDILPTILELINADVNFKQFDGVSLCPFFRRECIEEKPVFLQSVFPWGNEIDYSVGIRTSKYKYNRSINDQKKNQFLFDLKNDPLEENNIVKTNPRIVKEMECILQENLENKKSTSSKEISDEESKIIRDELKKLGYI